MTNFIKISDVLSAFFMVGLILLGTPALAQTDNIFNNIQSRGIEVFQGVRTLVLVLGGFGLIALAVLAIFGKIKWYWFGALAFGLLVVALAGSIVGWITGGSNGNLNDLPNAVGM